MVWTVDAPVLKVARIDPRTGKEQSFPIRSAVAKPFPRPEEGADASELSALLDKSYLLDQVLAVGGNVVVSIRGPKGTGWLLAVFDGQGRQIGMDIKAPSMPVGKTRDGNLLFAAPGKESFELAESALSLTAVASAQGGH